MSSSHGSRALQKVRQIVVCTARGSRLPFRKGFVLFLLCLNITGCFGHSDSWYDRQFRMHQADLNRIAQMSHEDGHVVRVSPDFTWLENNVRWPRPVSQLGFTPERWEEYKQLFRRVGSETGFSRPEIAGRRQILLVAIETSGVAAGGSERGFAFCDVNPMEIIHAGSVGDDESMRSQFHFRHIEGNWYTYARVY